MRTKRRYRKIKKRYPKVFLSMALVLALLLIPFDILASGASAGFLAGAGNVAEVNGTEYATLEEALSAWTVGSTLKLMSDVTTDSTLSVPSGEHTLDLNGRGIKMNGSGSVISLNSGASLRVDDSNQEAEHRFTVSNAQSNGAGLATVDDSLTSGYKTFTGGYITGGNAREGGGILVGNNADLTLNGGTIIGNRSSFMGAGVKVSNSGDNDGKCFTMNGGSIIYNSINGYGGGICSDAGVTMTGGTIAYNYASYHPGGIHGHYLYISGGRIENNFAGNPEYATGVHADHEVFLSGNTVIYGNLCNGSPYNVDWDRPEYNHGHKINLTGALSEEAKIGVTMKIGNTGVFTSGWKDKMGNADPSKYFTSDNSKYAVILNSSGEAEIAEPSLFDGSGTEEEPYLISSADDWNTLAESVLGGNSYADKFFKLTEDITVTRGIGSGDPSNASSTIYSFSGLFDGGGHTLDFLPPADSSANYVAPFSVVKNATIKNLKVEGKITANNNLSGLVGAATGTLLAENVLSDVDITGNFVGGFVGHGIVADMTLRSCAFTGDLKGNTVAGGFVCWRGPLPWDSSNTAALHMENSLFAGTASGGADFHPIGFTQQTNVPCEFSNIWATTDGKNNGKGFYNYQYQGVSYKSTEATVTSISEPTARQWMGYYDVINYPPVEGAYSDAVSAWANENTLALLTDVSTGSTTIAPSGEHTLDLNGHGILMTGNDRVVTINQGASLELIDSDPDRIHYITLTDYRGTAVSGSGEESVSNGNGVIKVKGGYLTGGYRNNSGSHDRCGAGVYNWGTFVMNGGNIVGNTLFNNSGGGIRNSGYFTMNGGTIAFNYASGNGGGVTTYVPGGSQGKMTMNGGEISDNYCGSYGGGIQIAGPIEMTGGSVVRNTAGAGGSGVFYDGKNDRFKLSGNPVIKDNSNNDDLYLGANATFMINGSLTEEADIHVLMNTPAEYTVGWKNIMGNADPSKYFTSDDSNYAVLLNSNGEAEIGIVPHEHDDLSFTKWSDTTALPPTAGNYCLSADVTISSRWDVPAGTTNLCLNGHSITRTNASSNTGMVINVGSGAVLNLYDCDDETTHYYTVDDPSPNGAGLGKVVDESAYNAASENARGTFKGGYITGGSITGENNGTSHLVGGGVNVDSGSFTLNGGTIIGNSVTWNGGGVKVRGKNGSFTMNGGAILANWNRYYGGGISVGDNNAGNVCKLTINGGTIRHNWSGRNGGAIHLDGKAHTVLINGGNIIDNYTDGNLESTGRSGGGILTDVTSVQLSGTPVIKGNAIKSGVSNDVSVRANGSDRLDLSGHLEQGADVGIYVPGWTSNANADYMVATGAEQSDIRYVHYDVPSEGLLLFCDGSKDWICLDGALVELSGGHHTHQAGTVWVSSLPVAAVTAGETTTLYGSLDAAVSAWTAGSTLKLFADVTTDSTVTVPSGAHTLDLNGYTITRTGATGNDNSGLAMTVGNGVELTVKGPGKITGGKGFHGGGIHVEGNSSLVLDNCEISGNTGHYGGGLYLKNGTITLQNGTVIKENSASEGFGGSGIYAEGGGTLVMDGCTFTNNAINNNNQYAVFLCGNANLKVSGAPVINNNTYGSAQHNLYMFQAGDQHSYVLISGALTYGTKIVVGQTTGAGEFTSGWKNQMGDADPSKYFTSDNDAYQIFLNDNGEAEIGVPPIVSITRGETTTKYVALSEAVNAWTAGSTLKLLADVTTNSTVTVPSGEHTLDLNGYTLKAESAGYSVVTVGSGAELTIDDTSDHNGKITGGSVGQHYGGGVTVDGGTLTLKGGAISGNANTHEQIGNCGGGVHVRNGGKLYMQGGEISGNTSYVGGGICTDNSDATVSITGGVIKNNQTTRFGSAIWAGRTENAIFRIGGDAQIIDNISTWTSDKKGEGTINFSTLQLSGDPTVHGDWKESGNSSANTHINLDNAGSGVQRVTLEDALTNDTGTPKITLSPIYRWDDLANGQTFVFTENWNKYMGTAHPADYFKVDDSVSGVTVIRKDGEAAFTGSGELGDLYITFDANEGKGTMEPQLATTTSPELNKNTFTRDDYDFAGWNTKADGSGKGYTDGEAITLSGDLTLYAQWEEVNLFEGKGTEEEPYLIQSADDWDALSAYINNGGNKYEGKHFKLTDDIKVTTALGNRPNTGTDSDDNYFSGVFDGDNHTLEVNIDDPVFAAPFAVAHNATIKNLHVTGTVHSSANHATGLVAASKGKSINDPSSLTIQNVTVSADVSCNSHIAGIVGHAHSADITMENVVFDGSLSASSVQGGMIGWGGLGNGKIYSASFKDCLFAGTYRSGAAFTPVAYQSGQGTVTLVNDFYTTSLGSGGSPIAPTGDGEVKLLAVTVEKDGKKTYFADIATASTSENWTDGSTLKLMADVTNGSTITVPAGKHTLDLNGYEMKRTGATGNDNSGLAITMGNGADLTVKGPGRITGGKGFHGGGIHVEGNSSLVLDNCEISGNTGHYGGGLYLKNGTITLKNGTVVKENSASEGFGGSGIYAEGGGTLILEDAAFTNNANQNNNQYAVFLCGNANAQISGAPVIYDNTYGSAQHNLYLFQAGDQHSIVQVAGELSDGAKLGVGQTTGTGVFTDGWKDNMGGADPTNYFVSDNTDYDVIVNKDGELEIGKSVLPDVSAAGFEGDYDGKAHGITVSAPDGATIKFGTTQGSYTLTESPAYSDAGTYTVYYEVSMEPYESVVGSAEVKINQIDAVVTITGNNSTVDFDGKAHNATGYTVTVDNKLYGGEKDFTFSGNAEAERTDAGTTDMGLKAEQFENTNTNFKTVTFEVTDGYITINPIDVTVTITGHTNTVDYDGKAHSADGYDAKADSDLYDVTKDFTYHGRAEAKRTDAGTTDMGLKAEQFENTNSNFDKVTFEVIDGYVTVNPIDVTVTITGHNSTVDYDGKAHTVSGYDVKIDNELYTEADFTYSGNAEAERTNAGTTDMGLTAEQFENTNQNFKTVTFEVTDGYVTINPIDVTVTITGHNSTVDYNGKAQSADGYDAKADSDLYDVTKDFVYNGKAEAERTDAGTTDMGLTAEKFENTNSNFAKVTFEVTDGYITINPIDVNVTITGHTNTVDYDGSAHSADGYDAKADSDLYDVTRDFTYSGRAEAKRTDAGTTDMGLTAEKFENTNSNFKTVTFEVTDGYITINPIDVTVTITGHNNTVDYDGKAHTVSGYDVKITNELYTESDFTFSGKAEAERTEAGTTDTGLKAEQFENTNSNFKTVTFEVTDGYVTINPIDVTVTITGHNSTVDYDGKAHTVSGYDVKITNELYQESDFTFSGKAEAERTNAGTADMGLKAGQFENKNSNFKTVTFEVTDGYLTVNPIDVTVTITGHNSTVDYDGKAHTVSGYDAAASSDLYDVTKDFAFSGTAEATRTNSGVTQMHLSADQFENTNSNFRNVTFEVTDGYIAVDPIDVIVTITGHSSTDAYDGEAHKVSGYDVEINNELYHASDFTFSGTAEAERTDAGTSYMGLAAEQFENTNRDFKTVAFVINDGYQTVDPISVTVTVTGHTNTVDYDGNAHSADGYDAAASSDLYDVTKDFTYHGRAEAKRTDAGRTDMGLTAEQFENTNSNFDLVTFHVTDGYQKIDPIDATVTVTGHHDTFDYDGAAHKVSGYDAEASTELYDVTADFAFSGTAEAESADAGTTEMGLAVNQFANTNANFRTVTFRITDGYLRINTVDAVITSAPRAKASLVYTGSEQELIVAGAAEGGTLSYALGSDSTTAPADPAFKTAVPTGKNVGNYYIWYKVTADANHNSLAPVCFKVTLAQEGWVTVSGIIHDNDGNPVSGASVSLTTGNKTVDEIISGDDGGYYFTAPAGVYNIVVKINGATVTDMVDITESMTYNISVADANTDSVLNVVDSDSDIVVGGLNKEADAVRAQDNIPSDKNVAVKMTVAPVASSGTDAASAIAAYAADRNLDCYDFKVEKTVDAQTTTLDKTQSVLEIVLPCSFTNKQELAVYRSDSAGVQTLTASDSKAAGTYRVDTNAGLVYIYTGDITTYAIGYKPYYSVKSQLSLGSFTGNVDVKLTKNGETVYELKNVPSDNVSFRGVPKGNYSMTIIWTDGAENTLTTPFEIK